MNIFEALRKDHDIQRELLKKLVETSGDTKERDDIFKKVKKELVIHEDGEERYFYIPLIDDDLTQEQARHAIAEHHEIDELLEQLEEMDYDSPGWLKIAKKLKHDVEHHLEDEERTIFQMAGKVLTEKEKASLSKEYQDYIKSQR
ncbi:hemerythrin HHE cation binding domain-containing protein [Lacinutrix venerupis]|uniref:Hemerythrin n=1 Tax=Lacinutrix venerupis TaxID=1486034 RepID=A0AAC9LL66_9FLAO|nr:hemerythrin domain-containing protein [Lacinutrix venerupis]APY00831.1 hemerythrin [Lacinutrix venerupis]RLJ64484.1 hemerythrin HHE cation binding domain-containing protein [Lacinutrix venerupis]